MYGQANSATVLQIDAVLLSAQYVLEQALHAGVRAHHRIGGARIMCARARKLGQQRVECGEVRLQRRGPLKMSDDFVCVRTQELRDAHAPVGKLALVFGLDVQGG